MNTKKSVLWAVLSIPVILLGACQQTPIEPIPDDPVEALELISERHEEIKSFHVDLDGTATIDIKGDEPFLVFFSDLEIDAEASADVSQSGEFQILSFFDAGLVTAALAAGEDRVSLEVRLVGDTLYTKIPGEEWRESPTNGNLTLGSDPGNQLSPTQVVQAIEAFSNTERLDDENIDGTDTYHFKISVDFDALLNNAALAPDADSAELELAQQVLQNAILDMELWVSKENLLIRQGKFHIVLNVSNLSELATSIGIAIPEIESSMFDMDIVVKFSRINEEINISAP